MLHYNGFTIRPIQLKELKYVMDRGLSNDSIKLYIELANDIDELY